MFWVLGVRNFVGFRVLGLGFQGFRVYWVRISRV